MRFSLAMILIVSGCVFPRDAGPLGPDPFADHFYAINEAYGKSLWVGVPTGIGNVAGAAALAPSAVVLAPFEWGWIGWTEDSPLFTGSMSLGSYVGGFAVGTPFFLLDSGIRSLRGLFREQDHRTDYRFQIFGDRSDKDRH